MTTKAPAYKICSKCNKDKLIKENYYLSASDIINSDGRLCICKPCLEEVANYENVEVFIDVLRQIDRPFIRSLYESSLSHKNPFGEYMKNIAMRQNRPKNYLDSEFDGSFENHNPKTSKSLNKKHKIEDEIEFSITPDILLRWGSGYSDSEIFQLQQFYVDMETANSVNTPQHREQLKLLCKLNLEQNKSLSEGKVNDFKNLNTQYNKILENSGFRPIDKLSGGESIGIRSFSQIWEEIEKDGFIPKHSTEVTQDIVDNTIMYLGNYTKKLLNSQVMSSPPLDTPKVDE